MTDKPETVADVLARKYSDDDLHTVLQDWDHTDPDQAFAMTLAAEVLRLRRIERAMAESAGPMCIVCDWQGDTARFIEAEIDGASVSLPWNDRPDGLKELRIERIVGPASLVTERMRKLAMAAFLSSKSDELIDCIGDALAAAHAPPAVPVESPPASVPDGWLPIGVAPHPERNTRVVYWHKSDNGGFSAIADEWRDEHHLAFASHWLPSASTKPANQEGAAP